MRRIKYLGIWGVGLALLLLGWQIHPALAEQDTPYTLGVLATITNIDDETDMATLRTAGGERFELPESALWHEGDTVLCDRIVRQRPQLQRCQLWSQSGSERTATPAQQAGATRVRSR